ncbi:hypothetical protein [Actinomadura sediminis]|uniref:Cell division protein DivIVA n=1 Tax=Actinomadura sediminis TaxID=1038904 RepID=A0ABW3EKX2_9ACTN
MGHSKLPHYLDGRAVPDRRVLQHYVLRPLGKFRPVEPVELATLMELHREACEVQPPKEPTRDDKITFLEQDLQQAREERDALRKRLDAALARGATAAEQAAQMARVMAGLREQIDRLTEKQGRLTAALDSLKEVSHSQGRAIAEYERKIADLEQAVSWQLNTLTRLRQTIDFHEAETQRLREHARFLQQEIDALHRERDEDRRLCMKIIAHQHHKPVAQALLKENDELTHRLARSEQTIAQLTETNAHLTAELDRVSLERDFLRSAHAPVPPGPPPTSTNPAAPLPALYADDPYAIGYDDPLPYFEDPRPDPVPLYVRQHEERRGSPTE